MMNKSYKKKFASKINFVLFCLSLFLEKKFNVLIFNIVDLRLLKKNTSQKNKR